MTNEPKKTSGHCNTCGGSRTHELLYSLEDKWTILEDGIQGAEHHEVLKCGGCGGIKFRHREWSTEDCDEHGNVVPRTSYYPPAIFRKKPEWLTDFMLQVGFDEDNIYDLLSEIYVALQNDQRALATMGIRALLESIMIEKVEDQGRFADNLLKFEKDGYVSRIQRERLDTILEAGHAAIHRLYRPSKEDLLTLVDIAESIVENLYIHGSKVERLKTRIPARKPHGG
jgi:hypothetical protein